MKRVLFVPGTDFKASRKEKTDTGLTETETETLGSSFNPDITELDILTEIVHAKKALKQLWKFYIDRASLTDEELSGLKQAIDKVDINRVQELKIISSNSNLEFCRIFKEQFTILVSEITAKHPRINTLILAPEKAETKAAEPYQMPERMRVFGK